MSAAAAAPTRTLLGLKQPGQPSRLVIWDTEEIRVGRSPESDIVVDDEEASREHALFTRGTADHFIQDLRTANGTTVNGAPLSEQHALTTKDVIVIGPLEITFIRTQKDPGSLGLEVVYASELKGFAGGAAGANPDATTLALGDMGPGGEFQVGSVSEFGEDPGVADMNNLERMSSLDNIEAEIGPPPRDLDLELGDMFITEAQGEAVAPAAGAAPAAGSSSAAGASQAADAVPVAGAVPLAGAVGAAGSLPAAGALPATGAAPVNEAPASDGGTLSLHLELEGLSPDLAQQLQALFGKVIELPAMRIRIKGDDIA
jgi:pSer/pThr/pTyr-binding forkhead associated (FHA) protein